MKKSVVALTISMIMSITAIIPAMAEDYTPGIVRERLVESSYSSDFYEKFAYAKNTPLPGWQWINGNCYYYTDFVGGNKLVSCVTPDGYTVDEQGRWTVDGVVQSNGYTSFQMNTDALYAGLNPDQRWEVTLREIEKVLMEHVTNTTSDANPLTKSEYGYAFIEHTDFIKATFENSNTVTGKIWACKSDVYNDPNARIYTLTIENYWNDEPTQYCNGYSEAIEKLIKLMVGDRVGQELFNDFKAAGDPSEGTDIFHVLEFDENGEIIRLGGNKLKTKQFKKSDGINIKYMDLNKWNGRKTDDGMTITLEYLKEPMFGEDEYRINVRSSMNP